MEVVVKYTSGKCEVFKVKKKKKFLKKVREFMMNRSQNSIVSFKHKGGKVVLNPDNITSINVA